MHSRLQRQSELRSPFRFKNRSTISNPVPVREEWGPDGPIHAEESLTAAFMGTTVSGQWTLRLRDTTAKELSTGIGKASSRHVHGDGGVAGWEVSGRMTNNYEIGRRL